RGTWCCSPTTRCGARKPGGASSWSSTPCSIMTTWTRAQPQLPASRTTQQPLLAETGKNRTGCGLEIGSSGDRVIESSENEGLFGWPDDPMVRWADLLLCLQNLYSGQNILIRPMATRRV